MLGLQLIIEPYAVDLVKWKYSDLQYEQFLKFLSKLTECLHSVAICLTKLSDSSIDQYSLAE